MSKDSNWKQQLAEVREGMGAERLEGRLRQINRGYGFIRVYREGQPRQDFFFHKTDLQDIKLHQLEPGDLLSFDPAETGKGPAAVNVKLEKERYLIETGPGLSS